jgi:hypothetical protein
MSSKTDDGRPPSVASISRRDLFVDDDDADLVVLTDDSTRLVTELVRGPGRTIPKLAAALARRK